MTTILTGLAGVVIAVGAMLAVIGAYGTTPSPPHPSIHQRLADIWARLHGVRVVLNPTTVLLGVAAGLGVGWATGWPVAAVGVAVGVVTIPRILSQPDTATLIGTLEALAEWTRRIADILASGAGGLEQAITASARTAPAPIITEVTALSARMRTRGLEASLWEFAREVSHPSVHRIVAALILRSRAGGRGLIDILDGLSTSLREEASMRRGVEADRAKSRTSTRALIGIIGACMVVLVAAVHTYLAPFSTVTGQLWMTVVVGLFGAAFGWIAWLTRLPTPAGFLFPATRRRSQVLHRIHTTTEHSDRGGTS